MESPGTKELKDTQLLVNLSPNSENLITLINNNSNICNIDNGEESTNSVNEYRNFEDSETSMNTTTEETPPPAPSSPIVIVTEFFPCQYQAQGCDQKFYTSTVRMSHEFDCGYRNSICFGNKLNILGCEWQGTFNSVIKHIVKDHPSYRNFYTHDQLATVQFYPDKTVGAFHIIKGLEEHFVFYYHSSIKKQRMHFIIFYVAAKQATKKFYYSLTIYHPTEKYKKITSEANCLSIEEDLLDITRNEKSVVLTHQTIENFVVDANVHIHFVIHQHGAKPMKSNETPTKKTDEKKKPRPPEFKFPSRGTQATNTSRSGPSVPMNINPTTLSSINKRCPDEIHPMDDSPLYSPSINKRDDVEMKYSPCHSEPKDMAAYKEDYNSRYCRTERPTSSLSKPMPKTVRSNRLGEGFKATALKTVMKYQMKYYDHKKK